MRKPEPKKEQVEMMRKWGQWRFLGVVFRNVWDASVANMSKMLSQRPVKKKINNDLTHNLLG